MIVDRSQQQQQQQERRLQHNLRTFAGQSTVGQEEDEENDEENIVIDMADEDEDELSVIEDTLNNNNNSNNGYGSISVYSANEQEKKHNSKQQVSEQQQQQQQATSQDNVKLQFNVGDPVWFDPNLLGFCIPGKVIDFYQDLTLLTIEGYAQSAGDETNDDNHNRLLLTADDQLQVYDLSDIQQIRSVKPRIPLVSERGVGDLVDLNELSSESIIWNLKLRFRQELVYTQCGKKILVSVNPFKQLCNVYNLDQVNRYDTMNSTNLRSLANKCCPNVNLIEYPNQNQCTSSLMRWLLLHDGFRSSAADSTIDEPHIFNLANEALKRLLISGQDQCFILLGDSGSGKTEANKLLVQYLATVNKSPTNLMTEQILESIQVLESFGNAKTVHNDNSSRFGKLLDVRFNLSNGFIINAKTNDLNLLDRTRIVCQVENERNYHIFYELLAGLNRIEKEKYGLQTAEKYFYLNQGHCMELANKEDGDDFRALLASMQVLGFNYEEQDTIFRLLASVLHLGNIYFHRKVLAVCSGKLAQQQQKLGNLNQSDQLSGFEGVEIGSDTEVRWVSHLLQIQFDSVMRCLTVRTTEATTTLPTSGHYGTNKVIVDRIVTPLNIDQALDTRDAIARSLYACLFKWLVQRINVMINGSVESSNQDAATSSTNSSMRRQQQENINNSDQPIYLCRTSESLCEFQPDKLSNDPHSLQSSLRRDEQMSLLSSGQRDNSSSSHRYHKQLASATISIMDAFGFENLAENNFEQLCINYAAELLQYHTSRYLLRLEQAEYAKERLRWVPIQTMELSHNEMQQQQQVVATATGASGNNTAAAIVNLISKKPLGIFALLDDECNFPKATDQSFVEKCHHNHTLNENYQRSRLAANNQEFGVRHFKQSTRMVWYQVDGFIEKNRDALRPDIVDLLMSSRMNIVADMLKKLHKSQDIAINKTLSRTYDGRYVSMKPRAATVAARFQDTLHNNRVLDSINYSANYSNSSGLPAESAQYQSRAELTTSNSTTTRPNPWFIICLKPNRSRSAQVFDVAFVQEQMRSMSVLELSKIRKLGYPVRLRYGEFVRRYKCLVPQKFLNNLTSCQDIQAANKKMLENDANGIKSSGVGEMKRAVRDVCREIVEFTLDKKKKTTSSSNQVNGSQYQCGLTKMFLNEKLYHKLETDRLEKHQKAIEILQRTLRMWLIRRKFLIERRAAIVIQSQIRGFLARQEFWRQFMAIVRLQRRWRQQLIVMRRKAVEARRKTQRLQQQQQLQELQAQQRKQANQFRHRLLPDQVVANGRSRKGSGHYATATTRTGLDIPESLAQLYRLQRDWLPVHDLSHLNEINLTELVDRERRRLAKYGLDNPSSVPFVVTQSDGLHHVSSLQSSSLRYYNQSQTRDNLLLEQIVQEVEIDKRYTLQNFLLSYYTIESPQFGYSRLPITRPFSWSRLMQERKKAKKRKQELQMRDRFAIVEQKAVAIYKLLLRYIDSDLDSGECNISSNTNSPLTNDEIDAIMQKLVKFKLIADYVIHLCLIEPLLRDEIYLQLASQGWQNPKPKSAENVWKLIINCLCCFAPTDLELSKFLLKYANDYCNEKFRDIALRKLSEVIANNCSSNHRLQTRKLPPTMLEYWANQRAIKTMAISASCYMDDHALNGPMQINEEETSLEALSTINHSNKTQVQIRSQTTAEELAAMVLKARNVPTSNLFGWSLEVQHEGAQSEFSCRLRGDDQLLDHLADVELLPEFTQLVKDDLKGNSNYSKRANETSSSRGQPMQFNRLSVQSSSQYSAYSMDQSDYGGTRQQSYWQPNKSTVAKQFANGNPRRYSGLSRGSNERHSYISSEADLLNATRLSQTSRLNRRYVTSNDNSSDYSSPNQLQPTKAFHRNLKQGQIYNRGNMIASPEALQLHRRSMSMQELQMASNAINGRYLLQEQYSTPNQHLNISGGHYASSYVGSNRSSVNLMQQQPIVGKQRRRSQTPNSMMMSNGYHLQPSTRINSSSAYSSDNKSPCLPDTCMLQPEDMPDVEGRRSSRLSSGSLSRDGSRGLLGPRGSRPRRSASSSSRHQPTVGTGSDYASTYSDYERVGNVQRYPPTRVPTFSADASVISQPPIRRLAPQPPTASIKPPNPQVERYKPTPLRPKQKYQQLALASSTPPSQFLPPLGHYLGSSAMSDTSDAASLASHVRGIKVPQHNGDLDQYLDDLFNPVLDDPELDELSDARSLATSIKGLCEEEDLSCLTDAKFLSSAIQGNDDENEEPLNDQPPDRQMLSPTFESLLKSLKQASAVDPIQDLDENRSSQDTRSIGCLNSINLAEIKALNEKLEHQIQVNRSSLEAKSDSINRASVEGIPAPPPQPSFEDLYSRAKTIRIGKWRWPPAREAQQADGPEQDEETAASEAQITSYYESKERKRLSQQSDRSSVESPLVKDETRKVAVQQVQLESDNPNFNSLSGIGKLKISSEMKAKLEQLTTSSNGRDSNPSKSQTMQESSKEESLSSSSVRKLNNQRKNLLEIQLLGQRKSPNESTTNESTSGGSQRSSIAEIAGIQSTIGVSKVLAAKQQLAAAAGVALAALDSGSQSSSRRQSAIIVNEPEDTRRSTRIIHDDELGPQSRTAISQRQAFYQMSASSDHIDHLSSSLSSKYTNLINAPISEHGGSEMQLRRPSQELIPPPVVAISSDNLKAAERDITQQPSLTRAMQMSSDLNEAGQSSAVGKESDRLYGKSIAKPLSQRQHESLQASKKIKEIPRPKEQWVSSPDPTLDTRGSTSGNYKRTLMDSIETASISGGNNKRRYKQDSAKPMSSEMVQDEEESCLVYGNVDWQVKVRKELFLPSETYDDPLVVQLVFAQLVADVFNPRHWTRLNNKERAAIKSLMKDNSIGYAPSLPQMGQLQTVKRDLIRMARSFGLYFTRSYPATNFALTSSSSVDQINGQSSNKQQQQNRQCSAGNSEASCSSEEEESSLINDSSPSKASQALKLAQRLKNANNLGADWIDMVAVHHSGLRLVATVSGQQPQTGGPAKSLTAGPQNTPPFGYRVLETLKYRDMTNVSQVGERELLVSMRNGKKCWLISSSQANQLATLLKCFHADYNEHLNSSGSNRNNKQPTGSETRGNSGCQQVGKKGENNQTKNKQVVSRRADKDALLASDDDHHGDRVKQRQVADCISGLNSKTNSHNDLVDSERVLSSHLANVNASSKQSTTNDKWTADKSSSLNNSSTDGISLKNSVDEAQVEACEEEEKSKKKKLDKQQTATSREEQLVEKSNKRNLWQNSLSRMSNKFSIFGTGSSSKGDSSKKVSQRHSSNQQQQPLDQSVVLDAWIETKVDFDEDNDDDEYNNATGSATTQLEAENSQSSSHQIVDEGSVRSKKSTSTSVSNNKCQVTSERNNNEKGEADGKFSLLQFALYNFREAIDKYSLESRANKSQIGDTSTLRGSLKLIETLRSSRAKDSVSSIGANSLATSQSGSCVKAENRKGENGKGKSNGIQSSSSNSNSDWTWRELAEMVKFTRVPLRHSLLKLPSEDLNKRAVDCFWAILQYMGDAPANQTKHHIPGGEVECVYLILMNCHNFPILRDEIYCQLMKQTTNNRSSQQDSCLRGWRLFSIVAAYFDCSSTFKPYLLKYLETASYDKRRAYCSVALLCLQNLRKTFKYGGRKNVPSIEEIAATSAGRNSKRQIYRLPGGTERVINTKSTTVVDDIIHEICYNMLNVVDADEMLEFSLYCIADGDLYTMPLNRDEYILDITTELIKNHQQYFLIFCRSIWHYPLKLDSKLYIEVIFNQIAPDYLEGLLLVLPSLKSLGRNSIDGHYATSRQPLRLKSKMVKEISRIAALLHRASGTDYMPHKDEIKYLLPKPIVSAMNYQQRTNSANDHSSNASSSGKNNNDSLETTNLNPTRANNNNNEDISSDSTKSALSIDTVITTPQKWVELVQDNWRDLSAFDTLDAKAQFLDIVRHWPLFGSSFFAIKLIQRDLIHPMDFVLALNKFGIQMLDVSTHETVHRYPFNEVISTRKVRGEDGALFLDLKCGNLMKRTIIRIQTDQAHEISRLIKQYIDIELLQQQRQQQSILRMSSVLSVGINNNKETEGNQENS